MRREMVQCAAETGMRGVGPATLIWQTGRPHTNRIDHEFRVWNDIVRALGEGVLSSFISLFLRK